MEEARSHQSVNWADYFKSIRTECPWSFRAYNQGLIDIVNWREEKTINSLGKFQVRMYIVDYPDSIVEAMAQELDERDKDCEWLFSYPGYGDYATPVKVLIQQDRRELNRLRSQLPP